MPDTSLRHVSTSGSSRGAALFIEQDAAPRFIRRRIKHACTVEEWQSPAHRAAKIREAWACAIEHLRGEGFEFVAPSPVTLYRDATGRLVCADIRKLGSPRPLWIDAQGQVLLAMQTTGLIPETTTYMEWAEGPLPYMGDAPGVAPDPGLDRNLQYLRHQNRALRDVIDAATATARDPIARDVRPTGLVDFRVRGYFATRGPRIFDSKQTGAEAAVLLDGQMVPVDALGT